METINEIQITYHPKMQFEDCTIKSSSDAEALFRKIWPDTISFSESFYCLFLNSANKVLHYMQISTGGIGGTTADPRVIFAAALKCAATGIIVAHNHPAGSLDPSHSDRTLTRQLTSAGETLLIRVLDHIILTPDNGFTSFADEGML